MNENKKKRIPMPVHAPGLKMLIPAAVLLAVIAVFAVRSLTSALNVEYVSLEKKQLEDWYQENGTISAGQNYTQLARTSGEIKEILVSENQAVKAGDVLLLIDAKDYEYERDLAEAELAGLKAQLDVERVSEFMTSSPDEYLASVEKQYAAAKTALDAATTVWTADQTLYAAGDISKMQYETDKASFETASAADEAAKPRYEESSRRYDELAAELSADGSKNIDQLFYEGESEQLKARIRAEETILAQLEDKISECTVTAGKSGVIKSLEAKNLSMVSAGTVLCTISERSDDAIYAEADILTSAAMYMKKGTPVSVRISRRGNDLVWNGAVTEVYDYAQKDTSALGLDEYRVHVKALLDTGEASAAREAGADAGETGDAASSALSEANAAGMDGYGAELSFCLYSKEAPVLPVSAVYKNNGEYFVYVNDGGRAAIHPITVEYNTGSEVVVSGGLSEGEKVINNINNEDLHEGVKIR